MSRLSEENLMSDEIREKALKVEEMLPRLMRSLYRPQENDPLQQLPVAQLRVLRILFGSPKSHSAVSEELGISVSAVTQVANRLEHLSLLERVESPVDRRVKHLKLTVYGLKCMKERQEYRVMRTMEILKFLPDESQQKLLAVLDELLEGCAKVQEQDKKSILASELGQIGVLSVLSGEATA